MAASAPFGLILPSRPVLTEPQCISPTQYAFICPGAPQFSHIVVFLLPGFTLPEGALAGVYIQLSRSNPGFSLLGAIGNDKQSAVFQVKDGRNPNALPTESARTGDTISVGSTDVTIGISIEQATTLAAQLEALQASQSVSRSVTLVPNKNVQSESSTIPTKMLAQRIIKNAFNFLASFAGSGNGAGPEMVPLKSFQEWWTKFERRIERDPGFLERGDA